MRACLIFAVIFEMVTMASHGQHIRKIFCYQYTGTDSTKLELASQTKFDAKGHAIKDIVFTRRWNSPSNYFSAGTTRSVYHDTLLIKRVVIERQPKVKRRLNTKRKNLFYHDTQGLLTREVGLQWKREIKNSARHRKDGSHRDNFGIRDLRHFKTKEKLAEIFYYYDGFNRRITSEAPELSYSTENRYEWTYDSIGRMTSSKSFGHKTLLLETLYRYWPGHASYTSNWYDASGAKTSARTLSWEYTPEYTTTCKLNANGKIINQTTTTEKNELATLKTNSYDKQGNLIRTVMSAPGRDTVTQLFRYQFGN